MGAGGGGGGGAATFHDFVVFGAVDATFARLLVGFGAVFTDGDFGALNVHTVLRLAANASALVAGVVVSVREVDFSVRHYGTGAFAQAFIRP